MKEAVNYSVKDFTELLTLAMKGDRDAAKEILSRQDAQKAEIEQLTIKANSKRSPRAEKTPEELAKASAYFRCALLVKEFGVDQVNMQTLTVASAFLEQGLAQGNLRQALNRVQQVIKAQAVTEYVFPAWIIQAATITPTLDENKKLEEEEEKVAEIKAIIQEYTEAAEAAEAPEAAEAAEAPAPAAPSKKGSKK